MTEIIPAILAKDYNEMKNKISLVRGIVPLVQVDICDGHFVPSLTWPYSEGGFEESHFQKIINEEEGMPFWEDVEFELDLMVRDAVENFDIYTKLGPKRIIFHIEAVGDIGDFRDFLEGIDIYTKENIEIGIAINPSTDTNILDSIISHIGFVQFMGNDKIGYNGVSLDNNVFEKIKLFKQKYEDIKAEVDIGVNKTTAPLLIQAGADKLVSGSAILNSDDIIGTIEYFKNL